MSAPRLKKGESGFNRLYARYRAKARLRGIKFNLTKTLFKKLTSSVCFYCGKEPEQVVTENTTTAEGKAHSAYYYNGLDRVDNKKGYTKNNVVPCCRVHNEWKKAMGITDFVNNILKTADYLRSNEKTKT